MIHRKFPGLSSEELLRVFAICQDDAAHEYERSHGLLANMPETRAGYAALFALADLWRSHSEVQRRLIRGASPELADSLDQLNQHLSASSRDKGWELLANLVDYPWSCVRAEVSAPSDCMPS